VNGYNFFLEEIPVIGLVLKLPLKNCFSYLAPWLAKESRFFPLNKNIMKHLLILGKGLEHLFMQLNMDLEVGFYCLDFMVVLIIIKCVLNNEAGRAFM
jgi:hypothetical protein